MQQLIQARHNRKINSKYKESNANPYINRLPNWNKHSKSCIDSFPPLKLKNGKSMT